MRDSLVMARFPKATGRISASPTTYEINQISHVFPLVLIPLAALLLLIPTNQVFVSSAFASAVVGLRALYLLVFRTGHLRLTWLLSTGLLLGYGLGTFNTAAQMLAAGLSVAKTTGHEQGALCIALAVCLAVCGALYFIGWLADLPVRPDVRALRSTDQVFLWAGLAIVAIAYVTGGIGYGGANSSEAHRVSALGALAGLLSPILPGLTVLLVRKSKTARRPLYFWMLLGIEFAALLPQGRRVMLYGAVVSFVALTLTGTQYTFTRLKTIFLLLIGGSALYCGNMFFYAMRYQRNHAGIGQRTSLSLTDNMKDAFHILQNGDDRYDADLGRNLRERTYRQSFAAIPPIFSGRERGSMQPMWGRAAIFNVEVWRSHLSSIQIKTRFAILERKR